MGKFVLIHLMTVAIPVLLGLIIRYEAFSKLKRPSKARKNTSGI